MGLKKKMRDAIVADEKAVNVVSSNMTLDEWYDKWIETCKKNCRNNTKETYAKHYKRVKDALGWRKIAYLGHTQLQLTTDLYMHVSNESLFKGMEQYEKVMIG